MAKTIAQLVTINKDDIAKYAALHGKANSLTFDLHGKIYAPGTLQFDTFAGARATDGKYHGIYRFQPGKYGDCPQADLNQLPGLKTQTKKGIEYGDSYI